MQLAGLTANGESSMTGKLTTSTIAVRLAATRIAAGAGLRWKELSREERMERMKAARIHVNKKDRQGAAQRIAKKAVEASGLNWKDLSTEERQEKVKAARRLTPKAAV